MIEDIVNIPDYSLYLTLFLLSLVLMILFFIVKNILHKKETLFEKTLKKYKELNLKQTKKSAYLITKYTNILAKNQKSKEIKDRLDKKLQSYKYKKDVKDFDKETISLYYLFLEVVQNE